MNKHDYFSIRQSKEEILDVTKTDVFEVEELKTTHNSLKKVTLSPTKISFKDVFGDIFKDKGISDQQMITVWREIPFKSSNPYKKRKLKIHQNVKQQR